MKEAELYQKLEQNKVRCGLCRQFCILADGKRGICGVRLNLGGKLFTLADKQVAAINLDPIEKKPLFHFLPGSKTLSFGTEGCNFSCLFCQNHSLSQNIKQRKISAEVPDKTDISDKTKEYLIKGQAVKTEELIKTALAYNASSISYTYSEPTIFFELMLETAGLAVEQGLKNIMVSNAFQSEKAMFRLKDYIQAANFDLKAFSDSFYVKFCGARLAGVLKTLRLARSFDWWLEITTLLIPNQNDTPEELYQLAKFIYDELGADTPWHISGYHPCYKMTEKATPLSSIAEALVIGKQAGLKYVYAGNVLNHQAESTYCPKCGYLLIERSGFLIKSVRWEKVKECPKCRTEIVGYF